MFFVHFQCVLDVKCVWKFCLVGTGVDFETNFSFLWVFFESSASQIEFGCKLNQKDLEGCIWDLSGWKKVSEKVHEKLWKMWSSQRFCSKKKLFIHFFEWTAWKLFELFEAWSLKNVIILMVSKSFYLFWLFDYAKKVFKACFLQLKLVHCRHPFKPKSFLQPL